ncbi:glycoside hydrolase family 97 catalytic domain-containing protein [Amycolatopsis sp. 195334CR]|uniref:glycoside hydrolase family 97 catalytic domain-containing protein n=1 Tax=Amycolatopsis sp. 195334CR TaxID=2814588 RepID=UPI001F5CBEFC|nr:glycoside hydrolase family 97 catalytic domain-containing protein [Amycolatopsis sp. 195334CR]
MAVMESDVDGRYGGSRLTLDGGSLRLTLPDPAETSTGPLATPWRTMVVGDLATVTESDLVTDLASPSKIADTSWIKPGAAAWSWWADNLVDSGWDASWIPELVAYANARNVKIWLWVRWQTVDTDSEREKLFRQYADWGAVGLKIDFVESDGQDRMRWYDEVFAATAKYRLMLNFHGAPIPRGTERTWPHVVTVEADFTPVTFSGVRPNSDAGELALAVVYESGVQHFADSPANYAKQPLAEQLLRVVPTVWDETRR